MNHANISLPGGRSLEIHSAGNPSSDAIIFHHGTPGASLTWEEWLPTVADQSGFAIAYSRAGYGESSRNTGRTVISNNADIAAIVDHFNIEKFVAIGWSGGGPHCLANTVMPQSVAAISIAGVGVYGVSDLNFLEGMGEENHVEFSAAVAGPASIEEWMQQYSDGTAQVTGPQLIEALGGLIGPADKRILTPAVAELVAQEFRYGLKSGYYGWMDDDLAFVQQWGFDLAQISKPVELWQGDEDFMVPHAHGQWLAAKIPTAELHIVPGEGHISLGIHMRAQIIRRALKYLDSDKSSVDA